MQHTPAHIAVDAVRHGIALLTYDLGTLPDSAPLSDLGDAVAGLQRALRRLEVLTVMHPELTVVDTLPPGAMPADEVEEVRARDRELEDLVKIEPAPTTVTLVTTVPAWAPPEVRYVAAALAGQPVTLVPTDDRSPDGTFTADIGSMLAAAVGEAITGHDLDDALDVDPERWGHGPDADEEEDDAHLAALQREMRLRAASRPER